MFSGRIRKLANSSCATRGNCNMIEDLKPCPFCGSSDIGEIGISVSCNACGATGSPFRAHWFEDDHGLDAAPSVAKLKRRESWNTRDAATYEEALEIWQDRMNGADEGRSDTKGGRAWLAGEFQLFELEALCIILRHEAGKDALGLAEILEQMT